MSMRILIVGYDDVFLAEALANVERSKDGAHFDDPALEAGGALSAISASVAAIESFISERSTFHAHAGRITAAQAQKIRGEDTEFRRLNALVKCFTTDGSGLEGTRLYEELQALMRLRGCLVHRSAQYLSTETWPDEIEEKHRALIPHPKQEGLDWTSRVLNGPTAEWAASVARRVLGEAGTYVPQPQKGTLIAYDMHAEAGHFTMD